MLRRRVYRRELRGALGYGATWFAMQQAHGRIPKGHRDHERGREWWYEDEAQAIVDSLGRASQSEPQAAA